MERLIQEGPDGRFQLLMGSEAVVPLDFCSLVVDYHGNSTTGGASEPDLILICDLFSTSQELQAIMRTIVVSFSIYIFIYKP